MLRIAMVQPVLYEKLRTSIENCNLDVYTIDGGHLWTDSIVKNYVFDQEKRLIPDVSLEVDCDRANDFNAGRDIFLPLDTIEIENLPPGGDKYLKGRVVSLTCFNAAADSYGHWLTDVLPRFALFFNLYKVDDIDYFFLPSIDNPWQKETLDLLSIPVEKVITAEAAIHLHCDELICTPFPRMNWDFPKWISPSIKELFRIPERMPASRLIYARRTDAKWRRITNEPELENELEKVGFEALTLAELNLSEKMDLFSNIGGIISMHGSSLGNTMFCGENTSVLELFGHGQISPLHREIAETIPLNYSSIQFNSHEKKTGDFFEDAFVDAVVEIPELMEKVGEHFSLIET